MISSSGHLGEIYFGTVRSI